jgi:TolB-like protein
MKMEVKEMLNNFFKSIFLFFIPLALFISFGCQPHIRQSPLPGDPVAPFPKMMVGDSWVKSGYSFEHGSDIYHVKVVQVESDGSFLLEVKGEKEAKPSYSRYNNKYEILRDGGAMIKDNVERVLDFPLFVGKKWKDKYRGRGTDGVYSDFLNDYVVDKYETVNTKAGSFKSFKIKRHHSNLTGRGYFFEEYWYSPEGKCIVKSIPSWKYGSELISYSLANAEPLELEKIKIIIAGEKVKIGILEFQPLNEEARKDNFGKIFTEVLTTSFVKSEAFKIIEREQLHKVLKEIELTQSGIIDTSNAKQIGKMVGANAIVIGSVTKVGNDMRLDVRIIDVETGIILTAEKTEGKSDIKNIGTMADSIVADLINRFYKEKK